MKFGCTCNHSVFVSCIHFVNGHIFNSVALVHYVYFVTRYSITISWAFPAISILEERVHLFHIVLFYKLVNNSPFSFLYFKALYTSLHFGWCKHTRAHTRSRILWKTWEKAHLLRVDGGVASPLPVKPNVSAWTCTPSTAAASGRRSWHGGWRLYAPPPWPREASPTLFRQAESPLLARNGGFRMPLRGHDGVRVMTRRAWQEVIRASCNICYILNDI